MIYWYIIIIIIINLYVASLKFSVVTSILH